MDFKSWEAGSNTEPRAVGGGSPAIALTAPKGISFATPKAIVSYAGTGLNTVAQQNLQMTAGQCLNLNAGKGISLFAQSDGINLIAHKGKLLLQSQHDETEFNAAKGIKLTASEGKIIGMATEIVLIAEDGSFIKIGDGITLGTRGTITHHGAKFPFKGATTMSASLPTFDEGNTDLKFEARYYSQFDDSIPAPDVDVEINASDGTERSEKTDGSGKTAMLQSDAMHLASAKVMRNKSS
ncbi:DUF2345 domain-containing protein [Pseudoduganella aquatica]|uniref:DUF2345 domain-containing protein n=1 Tax=Pseudoduganella aquatica TaxID=2660641 RepID=UPI001E420E8A|nr:DUF2345 domain-containing protein [Pseudoduganella aquatica]